MTQNKNRWVWPLALTAAYFAPAAASAQGAKSGSQAECSRAYVDAQKERRDGKLLSARQHLIVCAQDCLPQVMKECAQWLTEVNADLPTLVIEAKDPDGNLLTKVRVLLDGEVLAESLDGKAIEVDPGTHTLRFEVEGEDPVEDQVTAIQGKKNQSVAVVIGEPAAPPLDPVTPAPVSTDPKADDGAESGAPTAAYVLGGVGLVALGGAGFFWLSAESKKSDVEDSGCAPACSDKDRDTIEQRRLIGDIALGVGVVSLGIAAYLFLSGGSSSDSAKRPPVEIQASTLPKGGFAGVSWRY